VSAIVTGIVYALIGALVAVGGGWLMVVGGSPYYLVAGIALLATGALLIARRAEAIWLYALILLGTLAWAIGEVRFDWWALAARGDVIYPLGLWLLVPWVAGKLHFGQTRSYSRATAPLWIAAAAGAVVLAIGLLSPNPHEIQGPTLASATLALASPTSDFQGGAATEDGQPDEDWRAYGRSQLGRRYSPLRQITPANADRLKVAWSFRTGDLPGPNDPVETTFEVTPIKVGRTLYLCSQHQRVFALDAATGKQIWSFDPQIHDNPTFQHLTCRGVSYHETPPGAVDSNGAPAPAECPRRIFLPVNDGRMIALDADTGKPCEGFGGRGTLDLQVGMGVTATGFYEPTSPSIVTDRIIVVAGSVIDNYSSEEPSGVIRGFDIYTGRLVWAWDSGNADTNELPSPTHRYANNSPNSWAPASYDPATHLIYLPLGVKTPDIWGGHRTELDERYASALVALNVDTGKLAWSYQTVHHDLWDMDLPSQPTLSDFPTPGGPVPAILQPTKTGNLFVLDRRDGKLLVPAPEKPVPQGPAPGDHLSPTQPFSELTLRPPGNLTEADMWGATMFDQLACRIMFRKLRYEGIFTPPSTQGTLVFPGNLGVFEWGGIAVDPVRRIAIANPINVPFISRLIPRGPDNPDHPTDKRPFGSETGVQPMYGTPYGVDLHAFLSPLSIPCLRPPWGYMAGVDLNTGKIAWMRRNGTIRDSAPVPIPLKMGVPSLGGPMTTAGGVVFFTGTSDYFIRAYDVTNGAQVWQDRLPAGAQSTPMTYAVDGKQYVVTAAGGHGSFGTKVGDYIIAYSLPN
jgi:quinoprotein glucose dehydrogenase